MAVITGGDSGIGRSVAVHFAREGMAGCIISHLKEELQDAQETLGMVAAEGSNCTLVAGDIGDPKASGMYSWTHGIAVLFCCPLHSSSLPWP